MESLWQLNAAFAGFVLYNSLRASVLIVLVLLAQRVLVRQLSATGRYLLWLAVVIALVTPVGFSVAVPRMPAWMQSPAQSLATEDSAAVVAQLPATQNHKERDALPLTGIDEALPVPQYEISFADVLPLLWLGGVLLFMGIVLVRHVRFVSVVNAAMPAAAALQALLDDCRRQTGCKRVVQLRCSTDIDSPLIAGWLRPCLLLPVDAQLQLNETQLRHVLLHELMHVKNHDIAVNWLLALLQGLHWFNPLVWFGFNRLRFDRELARDAETLRHLAAESGRDYGRTLLQLSQPDNRRPQSAGVVGIADDHAQLRRRLAMIAAHALPLRFQSRLAGVLLMVLGAVAFSKPILNKTDESVQVPTAAVVSAPVASVSVVATPVPQAPLVNPVLEVAAAPLAPAQTATATSKPATIARPVKPIVTDPEIVATMPVQLEDPFLALAMADTNAMPPVTVMDVPSALPKVIAPAQTAPEEIVIVGRSLREKMWNAEVKAYEVFNRFNDDKMFNISCTTYAPTGTRIMKQTCKPEFELVALKASGRGYLENMQGDAANSASPALPEPMESVFARYLPRYQNRMQQVAKEHPEFMQAIIRYNKLRDEYLGLDQAGKH